MFTEMFLTKPNDGWVTSLFTRRNGYVNIQYKGIDKKNTVHILNSLTPQGASIDASIRIGKVNNFLGAGYYWMADHSTAFISTILHKKNRELYQFLPPLDETQIPNYAQSEKEINLLPTYFYSDLFDIRSFSKSVASTILYSYLAGDSMIMLHPNHKERLQFIGLLLALTPPNMFEYTRFTSNCSELDGNENIIGVSELAKKYRSHKKLHLPLDTIFVDLETKKIEGDGIKNCHLTEEIIDLAFDDYYPATKKIYSIFNRILSKKEFRGLDDASLNFIQRIEYKLGLREKIQTEWIMF